MNSRFVLCTALFTLLAFGSLLAGTDKEQEMVSQFLKKTETKHAQKLSWMSVGVSLDRINRENDYNSFTMSLNRQMDGGQFSWLGNATAINAEFGAFVKPNLAWSIGGEYWLKVGEKLSGDITYAPSGGTPTVLTNPMSEIKTLGFYTSFAYYLKNAPKANKPLTGISLFVGGTVGYYQTDWDLFSEYQNLNLSTAAPDGANTTFKGSAPGFSANLGVDFPIQFGGLVLSGEASYLYLNFKNVAWYNSVDQEVVATYDGSTETRVDIALSGVRAKVNLKKYFSW